MRETEFIRWIRERTKLDPKLVPIGPGDDCAVVTFGSERVLVTTDQVLDGVHFVLSEHGPRAAGRKAMGRGLSDVAAMAGTPVAATATVALPKGVPSRDAEEIYTGLRELADPFNCPIVGGDVGVWEGKLAIGVTVFAREVEGVAAVLRSGAREADAICVTGRLGGAWGARRHLEFTPRIREAIHLTSNYHLRSLIDISDGLGRDLGHICEASGVGAELLADEVPIHADAHAQSKDEEGALRAALGDGEDYELLFTLPQEQGRKLCDSQPLPIEVTCIGRIVSGDRIVLVRGDGRVENLPPGGWEHTT